MLPERMCARRASSSGEAGGPTIVAAHGPVVAGPNAGTRITIRDVNPTPPAAFTLNSAKASTVLLRCCRARVCKGYNREKADGQQITHCICPSVDGFHPVGEPQPMRISQGQSAAGARPAGRWLSIALIGSHEQIIGGNQQIPGQARAHITDVGETSAPNGFSHMQDGPAEFEYRSAPSI